MTPLDIDALPNWTTETAELFWSKVDKSGPCWIWTASLNAQGYGQVRRLGRNYGCHRVAYLLTHGSIPEGMQLDHLCRVRECVNPAHLEPVTNQENARRSPIMGRGQTYKTHCPQGHPYDEGNTYITPQGKRRCRQCSNAQSRMYYRRQLNAG